MEKYIDTTAYGAKHDIKRYLADGWTIKEKGLTLVIMEKDDKTYSIMAGEFVQAIKNLAKSQNALDNLELYLTYHFPKWLEKYANTPYGIVFELKEFAKIGGEQ